jgi:voltage-gated potassium channel
MFEMRQPASRYRFGLLVLILLAIVVLSGVSDRGWIRFVAAILNVAALGVGFANTRARERLWALTLALVAGAAGVYLVGSFHVGHLGTAIGATIQVILLSALMLAVLRILLADSSVTNQTMLGAIAVYLLLGQVFAWAFMALPGYLDGTVLTPAQQGEIPIYYSYVVLTTLGFGDIQPVGALAQRMTVVEALLGQLYLAILISRLVSLYSRNERTSERANASRDEAIGNEPD